MPNESLDPLTDVVTAPADTSSTLKNPDVIEHLASSIADPNVQQKLIEQFTKKKRKSYKYRTNAPYYKVKYAIDMIKAIDRMIETKCVRFAWYLKDFPTFNSVESLYLRIMQSKLYVIDNLDPDKKYKHFLEAVSFTKLRGGIGVMAFVNYDILSQPIDGFIPTDLAGFSINWKERLEKYLESATPGDPEFHQTGIILSQEEQEQLILSLEPLEGVAYKVTDREIRVVRTS